jgi:hypothetical protein
MAASVGPGGESEDDLIVTCAPMAEMTMMHQFLPTISIRRI